MRILVGPHEVAGYYSSLADGLKDLGQEVHLVTKTPHRFGYSSKATNHALQNLLRKKIPKHFLFGNLPRRLVDVWTLVLLVFKFDVFIMGFGQSYWPKNWDLPVLKLFRKTIIANLSHGSEGRPGYMNGAFLNTEKTGYASTEEQVRISRINNERVRRWERWATVVVGSPTSTSFFARKPFINSAALGLPVRPAHSTKANYRRAFGPVNPQNPLRVIHVPSSPIPKGSREIITLVEKLKADDLCIELMLLTNVTNQKVLDELSQAHLLLDQVFSDGPMPGAVAEAAALGTPSLVAGYGFKERKSLTPGNMWPPVFLCHPDQLESVLRRLVANPSKLNVLGRNAQNFVGEKWRHTEVGKRYVRVMEGNTPGSWWIDPASVVYFSGMGYREEQIKENVRLIVSGFGPTSLFLDHRPALRDALIHWASKTETT